MRRIGSRSMVLVAGGFVTLLFGCASGDSATQADALGSGGAGGSGVGGGMTTSTAATQLCVPGRQDNCACLGGGDGVQACNATGTGYGACMGCGGAGGSGGNGGAGGQLPCGDGKCADDESCHTCELDCGPCKPCTLAPSCDNAQIPPPALDHVVDFDVPKMRLVPPAEILENLRAKVAAGHPGARAIAAALQSKPLLHESSFVTMLRDVFAAHPRQAAALRRSLARAGADAKLLERPGLPELGDPGLPPMSPMGNVPPGGTVECGAPMLRIRAARVTVHEEDDDWANDIVYCAIQSEAATGSEIVVTPQTPNLDQGESFDFSISSGIFWGQKQPTSPGGNLMITYDCFEADSNDGYQNLLDSISKAAIAIGGSGVGGAYGWVFTVVGAVAGIVGNGLALDGDDHLFNANQIIPLDKQLELTNGRYWTVRRAGTHNMSDWDWELRVEAWGCAEYGQKDKVDAGAGVDAGADAGP